MTAIVHAMSRSFHSAKQIGTLKQVALFSLATGLLVSLLALTGGLDLSPGFF